MIDSRNFKLPILVSSDAARAQIEEMVLFVSTNKGKTWKKVGTAAASADSFTFRAPDDDLYWFAVQVRCKDMTTIPADLTGLRPSQKVLVDTRGR